MLWQDSEFASEVSKNLLQKGPSQMFDRVLNSSLLVAINIFVKVLAICLLNSTIYQAIQYC